MDFNNEEEMDAILAGMADSLGELEVPADVMDASQMDAGSLVRRMAAIRKELFELEEMHGDPKTDRGRELHSERTAVLLELRSRSLL